MSLKDAIMNNKLVGAFAVSLLLAVGATSASAASTFTYSGVITACDPGICNLVPIFVGDPVVGSITLPANPGEAFDLDVAPGTNLFTDYSFLVGGVIPVEFPAPDGVYINGSGAIDLAGNPSGLLTGTFVGGTLGALGGGVTIDLATGAFEVTVGFGTVPVASVEGTFSPIPVPAAAWLFGSALFGLAGLARRKAKA